MKTFDDLRFVLPAFGVDAAEMRKLCVDGVLPMETYRRIASYGARYATARAVSYFPNGHGVSVLKMVEGDDLYELIHIPGSETKRRITSEQVTEEMKRIQKL